MDYGTLKTTLADWAGQNNLTAQIPTFLRFAQHRCNRKLRIRPMETSYLVALDADGRAPLPDGYAMVKNAFVFAYSEALPSDDTTTMPLEDSKITQLSPLFVETEEHVYGDWIGDRYRTAGYSKFKLARQGSEFLVRPRSSDLPNLGMMFYKKFTLLSDDTDTNWLTDNADDLLLAGGMLELSIFKKKQGDISYWSSVFDQRGGEVGEEFRSAEHAGSSLAQRIPGAR